MLRLRPLRIEDESAALAAHAELKGEEFPFLLGYRGEPWDEHVRVSDGLSRSVQVPAQFVPATFLVAVVDDEIVGRVSIRHELNDWLRAYGGHIGYVVRPAHRRRGYATEMLRQGLIVARAQNVDDVLIFCDEDNEASARTIERCGGVYDGLVAADQGRTRNRRYWIR